MEVSLWNEREKCLRSEDLPVFVWLPSEEAGAAETQ